MKLFEDITYTDEELQPIEYKENTSPSDVQFYFYPRQYGTGLLFEERDAVTDEYELEKIITHHKDDENAEFPNIEDIQTRDFEEMTFILSIEQGKFIKDFLTFFKSNFDVTDEKNTNSNGNALYIALKNFSESIDKK